MIGNKNFKVFGPRSSNLSHFSGPAYQRGEGIASILSNIFKKIVPSFASKTIKKIASSDIAKDVTKKLVDHGTDIATNFAADLISGESPEIKAKEKLAKARLDIADSIRSKTNNKKRKNKSSDSNISKKKKKKTSSNEGFQKKSNKNFSIFHDH